MKSAEQKPARALGTAGSSWNRSARICVFALAATSIASLILHFYSLVPMQVFIPAIMLPAYAALGWLCCRVRNRPDHRISTQIVLGATAGLMACVAYDLFRLPFVLLKAAGSASPWALPLFKVMPAFGMLILGGPPGPATHSGAADLLGWAYHFSNGVGFGIMYVAAVGDPLKRHWLWAVAMAVGLEMAMLLMPYASLFSIRITPHFIFLTLSAHLVFGVTLGLSSNALARFLRFHRSNVSNSP